MRKPASAVNIDLRPYCYEDVPILATELGDMCHWRVGHGLRLIARTPLFTAGIRILDGIMGLLCRLQRRRYRLPIHLFDYTPNGMARLRAFV